MAMMGLALQKPLWMCWSGILGKELNSGKKTDEMEQIWE